MAKYTANTTAKLFTAVTIDGIVGFLTDEVVFKGERIKNKVAIIDALTSVDTDFDGISKPRDKTTTGVYKSYITHHWGIADFEKKRALAIVNVLERIKQKDHLNNIGKLRKDLKEMFDNFPEAYFDTNTKKGVLINAGKMHRAVGLLGDLAESGETYTKLFRIAQIECPEEKVGIYDRGNLAETVAEMCVRHVNYVPEIDEEVLQRDLEREKEIKKQEFFIARKKVFPDSSKKDLEMVWRVKMGKGTPEENEYIRKQDGPLAEFLTGEKVNRWLDSANKSLDKMLTPEYQKKLKKSMEKAYGVDLLRKLR